MIAMDANFGLVRKKNVGKSRMGQKHGDTFFIDDEEVQAFVGQYQTSSGKDSNSVSK